MPDKTPHSYAASFHDSLPGPFPVRSLHPSPVRFPGSPPLRVSHSDGFKIQPRPGTPGASRVLQRISSCMPRPVDSGGPPHPRQTGCLCVAFRHVKTVGIRNKLISKLYQHFRAHGRPYGLQDSLCTLTSSIVRGLPHSSMKPTLDTGGWLTLSRRGLPPRKIRRAYPGAITTKPSGGASIRIVRFVMT
jgi:hypothetical protein